MPVLLRLAQVLLGCAVALTLLSVTAVQAATSTGLTRAKPASFKLAGQQFLLSEQPFQLLGCELHPSRIPPAYWAHRLRMVKAMGCNTVPIYVFWNQHELKEGRFDFKGEGRDLSRFIRLAQAQGLWVVLRPGPYVCGEWDLGGLPPYLLNTPDIHLRGMDPRYLKAVKRYIRALAREVAPLQLQRGGPLLMLQIENEYGSYANDRRYPSWLASQWREAGIQIPFYTADGPTPAMLESGTVPGAAVGLDSGSEEAHWELARRINPGVPVFSSETYPGWLTHWGESWAKPDSKALLEEVEFLLKTGKSFSFYVAHGGTNFGFTAGANSGGKGYEPDVTSYDYDAPIDEQGRPTAKFHALRELLSRYRGPGLPPLPDVPPPIPAMGLPELTLKPMVSLWQLLPKPVASPAPQTFEALHHYQGLMLYRTQLSGPKSGKLVLTQLHDYATVFLDGRYIGSIDRRLGQNSIELPAGSALLPQLDILVEAMGRINFGQHLIDRKGITEHATLGGVTLLDWQQFPLPLEEPWVRSLPRLAQQLPAMEARPGHFFSAVFELKTPADTFIDMKHFKKGVVWVNGHNLGRFWEIGPQQRLYCPAGWLRQGHNEIVVLDLLQTEAATVSGHSSQQDD